MSVDEIVAHIFGKDLHPDDLAHWREVVTDVIRLHETPRRWCEADGFHPPE